ncbi:MAG: HD domain-containing phosphohydrolase, partial [Rhodovibrionaceae bacterium]
QAAARVAPLQADEGAESVGYILGGKLVLARMRALLRQPGLSEPSLDIQLLQLDGAGLRFVLPGGAGEKPLGRSQALDTPDSAAATAYLQPRGFAERQDLEGTWVLVTGRHLAGLPCTRLVKVARAEALGRGVARIDTLLVLLFLGLAFLAALIAFVWRHGASRRASAAAQRYRETAKSLGEQRELLRLVTDNQPTAIYTLDSQDRYRFANRKASAEAGVAEEDLLGKGLDAVRGPAVAADYAEANQAARRRGEPITRTLEWEEESGVRSKIVSHIPVAKAAGQEILIVEYDISEALRQRRQQERTLNDLVMTLIGVVDRRDPYAADHSRRVAQLAEMLAGELRLSEIEIESARIAGSLMNLGKILIPEELLTKEGSLTDEELAAIRGAQQMSAELLEGVGFRGPVAETLRQAQEHADGSGGPRGLQGEAILPTARILCVANAFVGMVSPRSWRASLSIDTAIEELLRQSGKHFDQRVIAALLNYLENKGGRKAWQTAAAD